MTVLRDRALEYAAAGIPVFPLGPRAKTPLVPSYEGGRGFRDATTDADQVRWWWGYCPEANIGGTPLIADGFQQVVVDIDVQNNGDITWRNMVARHHDLPDTLVARTGQGGQHLWFWVSERGRSKLGLGIDCKYGDSGYVVLPPSVHPITAREYAWEAVHPVAIAPDWLRQFMRQPPRPQRSPALAIGVSHPLVGFVAASKIGERNSRLFWAACRACEGGSFHCLSDALQEAAVGTGLGEDEVARVFQSAERQAR